MSISKQISKIKIGEKKVVIIFDNLDKLEIQPDVYTEFNLFKGKSLTKKDIDQINKRNELEQYLKYITRLISQKAYTKHQIKEKLIKKGASELQIEEVLNYLIKYHLIDDQEIVKEYLEYADYRHYGYKRIKEELFKKGISSIYIDKIPYDEKREYKHALILLKGLEKKYSKYNYQAMKSHIYEALIRLGYSYDIASQVLEKVSPIDIKKEKELLKKDYLKLKEKYKNKLESKSLKEKIIQSLLAKGYQYSDIKQLQE